METAIVYKGRDNPFTITLQKNGTSLTELEMQAITKFEIKYAGAYYNSVDNADGFSRDNANSQVTIKPYALSLPVSWDTVELIVYDSGENQHGLVWDVFRLEVSEDATT